MTPKVCGILGAVAAALAAALRYYGLVDLAALVLAAGASFCGGALATALTRPKR